ncbi:hypothetical protein KJK34_04965 [Flavobacterium sp. D11R37]|uniref:hypothetical protein n=1 Tax=Flavobacterium coralii TaxID=2838017 RepID=UPI001CA799E5|nr:hypothetical protein [Flavobacterium coralii]MBY8962099.1 hypothetical protein [Flavobacterium coralii]
MSNKKLILGIAAGVAALAVTGIILKRKGKLDGLSDKASRFGNDMKDRFNNIKESAKHKFDEVVTKGGDIADNIKQSQQGKTTAATSTGSTSNSGATGSKGTMNPATA